MEKLLKDRLNELKSKLSNETKVKLSKINSASKILELETRINEVEWLIYKSK